MSTEILKKFCKYCNETKNYIDEFHKTRNICKKCHAEKNKKYYQNRKKEINENRRKKTEDKKNELHTQIIQCRVCEINVEGNDFDFQVNTCKDCQRKRHSKYMRTRKQTEPLFKFIANYRTRVYKIFSKIDKNIHTKELLGEDLDFIKKWFEFCFTEDMTFDNQGSVWHVDHVIPISKFDVKNEDDVIDCFNWKNISPLSRLENITKKDNIIISQVKYHIEKLKSFCIKFPEKTEEVEEYISNTFLPYLTNDQ